MQAKENGIVTITADKAGKIFNNSNEAYYLFKGYHNINEIESFGEYVNALRTTPYLKKVLVNLAPFNYSVISLPLQVNGIDLTQYIFERWRVSNMLSKKNNYSIINSGDWGINQFCLNEQEVMHCFLIGITDNKGIFNFLKKFETVDITENKIRHTIASLYYKFGVNNKSSLPKAIREHNLDFYLPRTIFSPGVYECAQV